MYEKTVIVNNNHVAFNGGEGGISARPTAEQERFSRERHTGAIAAQREQMRRFDRLDSDEIDTSDLDPAERHEWTEEQWDRAEATGFLDDLDEEEGEVGETAGESAPAEETPDD